MGNQKETNQISEYEIAWNLIVELRKEITGTQKIRAQVIGFKITFVTTVIGYIISNLDSIPGFALLVPAFAAIFFDFLITSYSYSIKRTGYYIRHYLEEIIKSKTRWPKRYPMWEEYMNNKTNKQTLSFWGNYGITCIAFLLGLIGLYIPSSINSGLTNFGIGLAIAILILFMILNTITSLKPRKFLKPKPIHDKE